MPNRTSNHDELPEPEFTEEETPPNRPRAAAAPSSNDEGGNNYVRPIPMPWLIGLMVVILIIIAASLAYSNGTAAVVNILLGVFAASGLWLLWVTPSGAGKLEFGEILLGIWLLIVGMMIGSSPTMHPLLAKGWTKFGLDPKLVAPLTAPSELMWKYEGTKMLPTPSVPAGQTLVVKPSSASNGILLTDEGYDAKGLHTLEVWLQDKGNGYTSSSVLVHLPSSVTAPTAP